MLLNRVFHGCDHMNSHCSKSQGQPKHWRALLPQASSAADTVRTSGAVRFSADSPEATDKLFLLEAEEA